jgi:hypothetical protein
MLGQWRRVFDASDRAAAEKYAREQVQHGGAVASIELRERDSVEVIWPLKKEAGGHG